MTKENDETAALTDEQRQKMWDEIDAPLEDTPSNSPEPTAQDSTLEASAPSDEAVVEEGEPTEEAQDKTPPSDEGRDDPDDDDVDLSALPQETQDILNKISAKRDKQHRAELKRHINRQSSLEKIVRDLRSTPPPAAPKADQAEKSIEDISEDYPEIADWIKAQVGPIADAVKELTDSQQSQVEAQLDQNEARVLEALPSEDFFKVHGKDMQEWLETRASISDYRAYEANKAGYVDPDGAIQVIENFLAFQGEGDPPPVDSGKSKTAAKRSAQMKAASSPDVKSTSAASGIPRNGDRQAIWDATEVSL